MPLQRRQLHWVHRRQAAEGQIRQRQREGQEGKSTCCSTNQEGREELGRVLLPVLRRRDPAAVRCKDLLQSLPPELRQPREDPSGEVVLSLAPLRHLRQGGVAKL